MQTSEGGHCCYLGASCCNRSRLMGLAVQLPLKKCSMWRAATLVYSFCRLGGLGWCPPNYANNRYQGTVEVDMTVFGRSSVVSTITSLTCVRTVVAVVWLVVRVYHLFMFYMDAGLPRSWKTSKPKRSSRASKQGAPGNEYTAPRLICISHVVAVIQESDIHMKILRS